MIWNDVWRQVVTPMTVRRMTDRSSAVVDRFAKHRCRAVLAQESAPQPLCDSSMAIVVLVVAYLVHWHVIDS